MSSELDAIAHRIERLVAAPHEIRDLFGRVARPVLRALGYRPKITTDALEQLLDGLATSSSEHDELLKSALAELESNVAAVERAAVVHSRVPMAYASWLWKLHQIVRRVARVRASSASRRSHAWTAERRLALLAPLSANSGDGAVHVVAIDPLIDAARAETELLGRRRRLLEAAREALLDAAAALDLDPAGVAARQSAIASEIARIGRLQARGIDPERGLTHQLRQALTRGEVERVHAALVAMDGMAEARDDPALSALTSRALDVMWRGRDRFSSRYRLDSLTRSGREAFGDHLAHAVEDGLNRARAHIQRTSARADEREKARLAIAARQLEGFGAQELLRSALAVDGCFDVGGTLMPVRVRVEERRVRAVRHPTPDLALLPARGVEDLKDAVIEDPRSILLDLAAGRLLARRYIAEEVSYHERTELRGEVRVYVLDGSASMLGPRAAMRDAILIAELSTLAARLDDPRRTLRPVLYYRYFTKLVEPVRVVKTRDEVGRAITEALSRVRSGGTDIQAALLESFALVRNAQAEDPELARAQIVLVTDGEASVNETALTRAREAIGSLPIGVSIIALGQENPALRAIAARQRTRGERVFYHFVPDEELEAIVAGTKSELPLHLPRELAPGALSAELAHVVDEIEQHRRGLDADALARARHEHEALAELKLSLSGAADREGVRARSELAERDHQALARRFERWFPDLSKRPPGLDEAGADGADLELLATLLASLVEVVELSSSDPLERRSDAIELFERLLADAGLAPWRVHELFTRHAGRLAPLVASLRTLAGMG